MGGKATEEDSEQGGQLVFVRPNGTSEKPCQYKRRNGASQAAEDAVPFDSNAAPQKRSSQTSSHFVAALYSTKRSDKIRLWDEVALSSHRTSPEVAKQIALAQKTFASQLTAYDL